MNSNTSNLSNTPNLSNTSNLKSMPSKREVNSRKLKVKSTREDQNSKNLRTPTLLNYVSAIEPCSRRHSRAGGNPQGKEALHRLDSRLRGNGSLYGFRVMLRVSSDVTPARD